MPPQRCQDQGTGCIDTYLQSGVKSRLCGSVPHRISDFLVISTSSVAPWTAIVAPWSDSASLDIVHWSCYVSAILGDGYTLLYSFWRHEYTSARMSGLFGP